eukprot:CAMPEP_0172552564 /NCGR_PEP_ID=MMETSP1067-20121228/45893_1 /TAXON_ID=265564 ORGANISM="Thalassiosira punctigera, Strain Tpunct2005C2" /NCGR_SAMPLE_ID=MMETSP1067 /ASSEMBLY_ACC=CAM_ASM_000444 /LENGTH=595 /DNA_ID=CAMNT_0013340569 /DNA_START=254 /DNA_END=2041 /DNA_ORIENTATION=-
MVAHTPSSVIPMLRLVAHHLLSHQRPHYFQRSIGIRSGQCYHSFVSPSSAATAAASLWGPRHVRENGTHQNTPFQRHHKRSYQVSLARKDSDDDNVGGDDRVNAANEDIDDEAMARHNTLSRRLYRTLLRSCRRGVEVANRGNSIDVGPTTTTSDGGDPSWILLQPPMDQRKYGFARIVLARRGRGEVTATSSSSISECANAASGRMTEEEVGMAMEVLRFVHVSLGGEADDDLEGYYLGNYDDGKGEIEVGGAPAGAAAGRHSEGHYTRFLDEDEERGEGDDADDGRVDGAEDDWDTNSDDDPGALDRDESVLVTCDDIENAVRIAFRARAVPAPQSGEGAEQPLSEVVARRHRDAIHACSQLSEQLAAWGSRSSVAVNLDRGVRVVATSALMMRPPASAAAARRYRFCYRIRVENIADLVDPRRGEEEERSIDEGESSEYPISVERRAVQLLGRTWNISERGPWHKTSSSVLQRLLEEGVIAKLENASEKDALGAGSNKLRVVQTVNEPRTGAVGHLPVLGPGEVFEYMSGADIATPNGAMEGCLHMASVNMQSTDSAHVGDVVDALHWKSNDKRRFEMPIRRFGLVADEEDV